MANMKCQEILARAVARTKGKESAAAKALVEFESRRAGGEDVILFPFRGKWLVGSADELRRLGEQQRLHPLKPVRTGTTTLGTARPSAMDTGREATRKTTKGSR